MTTKSWVHVGTITTWKGQKLNISLFSDDDTVALGITDDMNDIPFISDTYTITKDMFTQMMGMVVKAVNGNKILKGESEGEPEATAPAPNKMNIPPVKEPAKEPVKVSPPALHVDKDVQIALLKN